MDHRGGFLVTGCTFMSGNSESSFTIRDGLRIFFRHFGKMLIFFLLAISVTIGLIYWSPRVYESEAKIFVRMGRENSSLDPTATSIGKQIFVNETRESEINSLAEILENRELLMGVVREFGAANLIAAIIPPETKEEILAAQEAEKNAPEWWNTTVGHVSGAVSQVRETLSDSVPEDEKALDLLISSIEVWIPKKSTVIAMRTRFPTPELAQKVNELIVRHYLARHAEVHRTPKSYDFFATQTARLKGEWNSAADELRRAKDDRGLVSLDGQRRLLENRLGDVQTQLSRDRATLAEAESKVKDLKTSLEKVPHQIVTSAVTGHPNVALDTMRSTLYGLEISEKELASKYTDDHPQVVAVRAQLKAAQRILTEQPAERTQTTTAPHPARQTIEQNLLVEQAQIEGLRKKVDHEQAEHVALVGQQKSLNEGELLITRLEGQVDLLQHNYRQYAESLEQARIDQALEAERITNLTVIEQPTFQAKPVSPKKMLIAGAGLAVAIVGSLLLAIGCEYLDRSIKTQEDAEQALDLPVLVTIPRTAEHRLSMN